jgi:threonine synthase
MDISKASNYERLVFDILERDPAKTSAYMNVFNMTGRVSLHDYGRSQDIFARLGFESGSSTHENRLETIRTVYRDAQIVIDPHTADGAFIGAAKQRDVPMISLETALPVKFEHTIQEALGFIPKRPSRFIGIEEHVQDDAFTIIDADAEQLKRIVRSHAL